MTEHPHTRSGQAIIEMVVGIVALLLVFAGLVQLGLFSHARTQMMMEAREQAAVYASSDGGVSDSLPRYIYDWDRGRDERRHSADDEPILSAYSAQGTRDRILGPARPDEVGAVLGDPANELTRAYAVDEVLRSFHLVGASERSDRIPVMPVVRKLLMGSGADSFVVTGEAWLVWTDL